MVHLIIQMYITILKIIVFLKNLVIIMNVILLSSLEGALKKKIEIIDNNYVKN